MWIAKPLMALTEAEKAAWCRIQKRIRDYGRDFPLSQTLTWAQASESIGSEAFLVMEPDLGVGGILQRIGDLLECINGPLLNWDDPFNATREFATFAMGASKACQGMRKIILSPRWIVEHVEVIQRRLNFLPVGMIKHHEAQTLQIPIASDSESQLSSVSPRIRRSYRKARESGIRDIWVEPLHVESEAALRSFAAGLREFGLKKNFFVPDPLWFSTLVFQNIPDEKIEFALVSAKEERGGEPLPSTQLLVVFTPAMAYYLFGYDERNASKKSNLSSSSVAHFAVLEKCRKKGIPLYDLNGFTDLRSTKHTYWGVSQFKSQWRGNQIQYFCPCFEITV